MAVDKLPYLNLGCGTHYHNDWVNLDFVSTGEGVIAHNLLKGIPFKDYTFEVVYHSHVLEHFTKDDGVIFLGECHRVLKPGGILRVAIPDLEKIVQNYQEIITQLKQDPEDKYLQACYEWILLEMYDQTIRKKSGGGMAEYLKKPYLVNEDFILRRCGDEVKFIIDWYRKPENNTQPPVQKNGTFKGIKNFLSSFNSRNAFKSMLARKLLGKDYINYQQAQFRNGGEIHQWMYDGYSLTQLLTNTGFNNIRVCQPFESRIKDWNTFALETADGKVRKPDSLFIEASK